MTPRLALLRAAQLLEEDADALRDSHTVDGEWVVMDDADHQAQIDHEERRMIAAVLKLMADVR